jgi:hypothetical protein
MPPTRGRENSNLFSGALDLKLTSRSYALRFQLWGAHAPRVPISAPRRNASLAQPKEIVGEAPTTAGAHALPRKEQPHGKMAVTESSKSLLRQFAHPNAGSDVATSHLRPLLIAPLHALTGASRPSRPRGERRGDTRRKRRLKHTGNSDPQCAIEAAVLDCFADVFGGDGLGGSEVGDGAGDFENAIVGAGAEV